jgi:GMP synthase-like glutamine amidotransferase
MKDMTAKGARSGRTQSTPRSKSQQKAKIKPASKLKAKPKSKADLPILIVQHAPHEHPAAVRRALESQGLVTLWLHPYRGEPYPRLNEISGMISLGGPMSANDEKEHPWIKSELKLLKASAESGKPTVGICLGGQMMARALGGYVERHDTQEVGWFPVEVLPAGREDPVVGAAGETPTVYHWHGDTFHLPPGAELLARSRVCARQAYKITDRVYGFQFHPEADHQLVLEWLELSGVEEEIEDTRRRFGTRTVQDAKTQRNIAMKGEKASLKITAAIGALFRTRPTEETDSGWRAALEAFAAHRTIVMVEFHGSLGRTIQLRGRIDTLLSIPSGEFIIFQEENTLLWPIRLEDISRIAPVA